MFLASLFHVLAGATVFVQGQVKNGTNIRPNPSNGHWVDAWASMPQLTEPANLPPAPFVRAYLSPSSRFLPNWHDRIKQGQSL